MVDQDAGDQLAQIERLLDQRVGTDGVEDLTIAERVADVIEAFETWSDLAIKRLHEIHRLIDSECQFCGKYLDDTTP